MWPADQVTWSSSALMVAAVDVSSWHIIYSNTKIARDDLDPML